MAWKRRTGREMILTAAGPMVKVTNQLVATRLRIWGKESGGGGEFDTTGGEGEDGSGEGMEIPTAAMVKARLRCWLEEAILLGKYGFCKPIFVCFFIFLNYYCQFFFNEI